MRARQRNLGKKKTKRKEEIFSLTGVEKDGIEYVFLIDV